MTAPAPTPAPPPRPPRIPKYPPPEVVESPRIAALAAALGTSAGPAALAALWAEARRTGTPLVEPAEAPTHRVVTFLWRPEPGATAPERVLLLANKLTDPSVWAESLLEPLAGGDLWHRSYRLRADWRATYQLAPLLPAASGEPPGAPPAAGPGTRWGAAARHAGPDPLNPKTFPGRGGARPTSVVELPDAPPQPHSTRRAGVPRGTQAEHRLASAILGNERTAWVHVPPAEALRDLAAPPRLLVLLDGEDWARRLDAATILDSLRAAGAIPPTVAVMPETLDHATRWRELACHAPFVAFLADELAPWAAARWGADPARATIAGHSLGGLTALFAALERPDAFGAALAQSASLWWPSHTEFDRDAGWLTAEFARRPRQPVAVHLAVGLQEWALLARHQHLRDVLRARGYRVGYAEYHGGHDALCWRGGLASGLASLARLRAEGEG